MYVFCVSLAAVKTAKASQIEQFTCRSRSQSRSTCVWHCWTSWVCLKIYRLYSFQENQITGTTKILWNTHWYSHFMTVKSPERLWFSNGLKTFPRIFSGKPNKQLSLSQRLVHFGCVSPMNLMWSVTAFAMLATGGAWVVERWEEVGFGLTHTLRS